jgi:4-amino-4-deoxy-L-arabinose transferase-like glycosyltransferase
VLVAATAGGLGLRLLYQLDRPFVGDEVGTLKWMASSYGFLLTHFIDPWLTMPIYIALEKLLGEVAGLQAWVLVAPSLVASVAAIPLVAALALRFASPKTAVLAALLTALHPYLMEHGVTLRSYSLTVAFTLAAAVRLVDWTSRPGWRAGSGCALWTTLALLFNANAIYQMPFFAAFVLSWAWQNRVALSRERGWRDLGSLLVPVAAAAVAVMLAYLPVLEQMRAFAVNWSDAPPSSLGYLPELATIYFPGARPGGEPLLGALPSLLFVAVGVCTAARRRQRLLWMGWAAILPPIAASLYGLSYYPGGYARTFLPIVPFLLVLLAEGLVRLRREALTLVGLVVVAGSWLPGGVRLFEEKSRYPWHHVGAYLARNTASPDVLVTNPGLFTQLHLDRFLPRGVGFASPADLLRLPEQPDSRYRVWYVNAARPVTTGHPVTSMGRIQVVLYEAGSRREALEELADDLLRSLDGEGDPAGLASQYHLLLKLAEVLELPIDTDRYRALFHEHRSRSRRWRSMPAGQRRAWLGVPEEAPSPQPR